jgi:hypothetical protein
MNSFQSWYVGHINKEAIFAAYCLAKVAIHQSLEQVWIEDYHVFIRDIVFDEQIVSP